MSVHYKFKNTISQFDKVTFKKDFISLSDFKEIVVQQKHLSKSDDDLKVINAETKREYKNDDQIPKNTSLIISRVPLTPKPKTTIKLERKTKKTPADDLVLDLLKLNISEEKKIEVMMKQSAAIYNPKKYQKLPNNTEVPSVPPPKNYKCKSCYLSGHWIQNCPSIVLENRGKAGIPRSFLQSKENKENKKPTPVKVRHEKPTTIPDDMLCPICKDLFTDAVMIPCCGNSFCDDCIRNAILESTDNTCPSCKETDTCPDALIPNRYLRKRVTTFKCKSVPVSTPLSSSSDVTRCPTKH